MRSGRRGGRRIKAPPINLKGFFSIHIIFIYVFPCFFSPFCLGRRMNARAKILISHRAGRRARRWLIKIQTGTGINHGTGGRREASPGGGWRGLVAAFPSTIQLTPNPAKPHPDPATDHRHHHRRPARPVLNLDLKASAPVPFLPLPIPSGYPPPKSGTRSSVILKTC